MTFAPKTDEQKAHYYLEVAENCRKKGEMNDKLIASGQVKGDKLKELKEQSRYWWNNHEEYLRSMSKVLKTPFPEGESIEDIVAEARKIFSNAK